MDSSKSHLTPSTLQQPKIRRARVGAGNPTIRSVLLQLRVHAHILQPLQPRLNVLLNPPNEQLPTKALLILLQILIRQHPPIRSSALIPPVKTLIRVLSRSNHG
jgi:hypothetical protein